MNPDIPETLAGPEAGVASAAAPAAKDGAATPDGDTSQPWDARGLLRIVASLVGFFLLMALLAKFLGPQIEGAGKAFVERFGYAGMAIGVFGADAFSLPPPPLFFIIMIATSAGSHVVGLTVISLASIAAGNVGYHLAGFLAKRPFFKRRIDGTRARMDKLFARYGVWAFVIASFTPMPFSFMCYVSGIYRIRPALFAFVCFTRIPRLLVMYWLVVAGWMTGGGGG